MCVFESKSSPYSVAKQLVVQYEEQCQNFMNGTTVSQFKEMFPASATPSKLSTGKVPLWLKLHNKWGDNTLSDLIDLVSLFGVPGDYLHLSKARTGCIAVIWLSSISDAKKLKGTITESASSLKTKGVLQVFIGEELVFDHHQGIITQCAYVQGRVKRLSPSIYLCVCICVCRQKHGCLLSYCSKIATK